MIRVVALSLGVGLMLVTPAVSAAATLDAGKSCYFNNSLARISGSGFAPNSQMTFTANGNRVAANISSDDAGDFLVDYEPRHTDTERKVVLRATDSEDTSARVTIWVTRKRRVTADPSNAPNVRTWEAVIRLWGFGRGRAYIHYRNPKGHLKKTVRLGRLRGPCGRLKTEKRPMMPFDNPAFGVWRLQFDTHRRFKKNRERKRTIPVRVYRG